MSEATAGFEPANRGFADPCLTTWLRRLTAYRVTSRGRNVKLTASQRGCTMANAERHDETLYCARCGISFLWTVEEQKQPGASQPLHCHGCRLLMPSSGRERGLVKWFDRRKQYGFIVRAGQPELYVHRSAVQSQRLPRPGDLVEFDVESGERGQSAVAVTLVDTMAVAD